MGSSLVSARYMRRGPLDSNSDILLEGFGLLFWFLNDEFTSLVK